MPSSKREDFYNSKSFLIVGMSKKKRNFGWSVYKELVSTGKKVYAVHPENGEHNNVTFYRDLESLPERPDACVICVDLKKNSSILSELTERDIGNVWFQQGSYDDTVLANAKKLGMAPLTGCVLMYMPGSSFFHRFHRFFHDLLSKGQN